MLLLLILVFLGPWVGAYFIHQRIQDSGPPATVNRGELIEPARPLPALPVERLDGQPLDTEFLRGRWTLIQMAANPCDEACRQEVYDTRQVRTALGKEQNRVQRLLVLPEAPTPEVLAEWRRLHPNLTLAVPQNGRRGAVLEALGEPASAQGTWLYVTDPLGNLMMRYPPDAEAKGLLKDMERLLRVSQIG